MPSSEYFNCSMNSLQIFDDKMPKNRSIVAQFCETQTKPFVYKSSGNFLVFYLQKNPELLGINCKFKKTLNCCFLQN